MISERYRLDPSVFDVPGPLKVYRIARTKHANLSGQGAALEAGRWNMPGEEAIYTSMDIGVPVLEVLVHTPKDRIPIGQALMRIRISGRWDVVWKSEDAGLCTLQDASTSGNFFWCASRMAAEVALKYRWMERTPVAVALPSVVAPAWNVVLSPKAPAFWKHVTLESIEPFQFDERLFPDGAVSEPEDAR